MHFSTRSREGANGGLGATASVTVSEHRHQYLIWVMLAPKHTKHASAAHHRHNLESKTGSGSDTPPRCTSKAEPHSPESNIYDDTVMPSCPQMGTTSSKSVQLLVEQSHTEHSLSKEPCQVAMSIYALEDWASPTAEPLTCAGNPRRPRWPRRNAQKAEIGIRMKTPYAGCCEYVPGM